MGSQEQQQQQSIAGGGGSRRIVSFDEEEKITPSITNDHNIEKPGWRNFLSYVGPGFLVSLAYLDPGNLETDLQAGANHRYEQLLWVILVGLIFALIIQSLAANLGVSTGKHLSELCKAEYPKYVRYCLWLLAELAVIAADIPEVIGTAFALNILLHIPVWVGVLFTGSSTLLLLGLQRYGVRKLELLIAILVFVMAGCYFGELSYVKPPFSGIVKGMFIPKLKGQGATGDAIALLGALVMPHNLFLHSALVLSRKVPQSVHGINSACKYFLIESGFALFVAFLINVAVISVTGTICADENLASADVDKCQDLTLNSASFLLKNTLGKASSTVYAVALLASGQSSTITGTYAGQYIMQGFLDLKMKTWARNLMTRLIAITPSLVVSIIGGSSGAGRLIIIASGEEEKRPLWKKFLPYVGPGFLVSLAYLDPGNLQTDLQAGADHKFELLWVILIGLIFALIIQSLAANLGVTTGKHLSEICKLEYPRYVNYSLWLLAEIAVIAADIPEVIGTAFALNILFHIPVWAGVLLTGFSTLILLGLQRYGIRKIEILIAVLVFVMAGCFFAELSYVAPPIGEVLKGMFIPKLSGKGATGAAIALFGALIMPHNLFLHSAIVLSRKIPQSVSGINSACRYFLIESGFALLVAFLINVAVISVSGDVCSSDNLTTENKNRCSNLNLNSASFLLENVLRRSSSTIYAIALLASGQSSTITGTYAGQYIMQGFLNLKMKMWVRNLMTRCIAIIPSLIVSIIAGSSGAGQLIIVASIIWFSWILGICLIVTNIYYLMSTFVDWLLHNHLPKVGKIFIGIFVFPLITVYITAIIYLACRKDRAVTFIDSTELDPNAQISMEGGLNTMDQTSGSYDIPYRDDLAEMTLQNKQ
ncbi:hypothetical protein GIB67_031976 [Kingdonia uniflora]|uniref:Uncharacterized protein n=1 Tax=Kingdonia uniflora TaxID=39325 RepID=A0A7J7NUI7_9MAGN|nr:hypothetical protein GIB67_031976 [Kingdonia uniflora]